MLLLFWFALLVADGTPIGRTLRWMLVEVPAGWCNRWSRGDMLLVFTLLAGAALILWLMEAEGRLFLGMLGPDIVAGASMLELGTLLDVAVMAVTVPMAGMAATAAPRPAEELTPDPQRASERNAALMPSLTPMPAGRALTAAWASRSL